MIILLLQRHFDVNCSTHNLMDKIRRDRQLTDANSNYSSLQWDCFHPEEISSQVKLIINNYNYPPKLISGNRVRHIVMHTNSLIMLYEFNNALSKDPYIHLEAYEAVPPKGKKVAYLKPAIKDGWIDETILSHAYDNIYKQSARRLKEKSMNHGF